MPSYSHKSTYFHTETNEYYLDLMVNRPIPKYTDDAIMTITEVYNMRPDILAYDLYDDSELWWVFAQRNPDTLKNPIHDFKTGTDIFIPKLETLRTELGF